MLFVMGNLGDVKIVTYDNFPFGGAPANYLRYFALSIQNDCNVEVIMPTGNYGNAHNINKSRQGWIEKVKYRHLGYITHPKCVFGKFVDNFLGLILPLFFFIKKKNYRNLDAIIIYNIRITYIFLFWIIKHIIKRQLVIILPEIYERPNNKFSFEYINWIFFYIGLQSVPNYADKFIVLTDYVKSFLIRKNVKSDNVLILPNLTDPKVFKLDKVDEFKENTITIGYCGTPTRKDGILDLIDSFTLFQDSYPNSHLLIIGDMPGSISVLPKLKQRVKINGIENKVTFTGIVPFSDIPNLLNSCQILALTRPSGEFAEAGFPTKLGEYFACKKPVLVTAVGDVKKYFVNEVHAIIVEPNNILAVYEGFVKIVENPNIVKKIVDEGYKWVCANIDYQNLNSKILLFLKNE